MGRQPGPGQPPGRHPGFRPPPGPPPSGTRLKIILSLGLLLVTFLAYRSVLECDFIDLDDRPYVVFNPHVKTGLTEANLAWGLTSFEAANWHPLTWFSLQLDCDLFGGLKPEGYHLTNLLLHMASSIVLLHALARMTGAIWRSALVAALFALHPLHVESVAWIAERKDVLSAFFWMLTLWAYVVYVERLTWSAYAMVTGALALGLMAKPMLVTLPCVLLLLDYWPLGRWGIFKSDRPPPRPALPFRHLLIEKLPLFALIVVSCVLTIKAQERGHAFAPLDDFPLGLRLLNAARAYAIYLLKMVWPVDLTILYPLPGDAVIESEGLWATGFLVAVTVAVLLARRRPYLAVGWFWYLGTLVPTIGLVQVGSQAFADRYTYIPLIGIFIALAWGLGDLVAMARMRWLRMAIPIASCAAVAACAVLTFFQVQHWQNTATVWDHALMINPRNSTAHERYGSLFIEGGARAEGLAHLKRAVELNSRNLGGRFSLGSAYLMMGNTDLARAEFQVAIKIRPDWPESHQKMALTEVLSAKPDLDKALAQAERAVDLGASGAEAYALLGYIEHEIGHPYKARDAYNRSLELNPDWPQQASEQAKNVISGNQQSPFNLRSALMQAKQACQATEDKRPDLLQNLADVEIANGRITEARETLRKAASLAEAQGDAERARDTLKQMETLKNK